MTLEEALSLKRPRIPTEFYHPSLILTFLFIFSALLLYVGPAVLARTVAFSSLPILLKGILLSILILTAAQGLILIGWVGHEGFHLSLARNKFASAVLGVFIPSIIIGYFEIGFSINHWNHHRFTNQASDPDCKHFQKYRTFWSRLLLARLTANARFIAYTLKMTFGHPLPFSYTFPFKAWKVVLLAWLNIFAALFWLGLYVLIGLRNPLAGIVSIGLPMIATILISGLQPYLEHAGTDIGLFKDARSRIFPLLTVLYFGNNYHLEHHLYPGVPCYRLPALHRYLREMGFYDQAKPQVDSHLKAAYVYAKSASQYPQAGTYDSEFDPMLASN